MMIRSLAKFAAAVFAATLTLLPSATPVHAQSNRTVAIVNVPFDFQFSSKHFDAGRYEVRNVTGNILMLKKTASKDQGTCLMVMRDGSSNITSQGKVVFHQYGDTYFLSEVWQAGYSDHLRAPLSEAEKQLQKSNSPGSVAKSEPRKGAEVALLTK